MADPSQTSIVIPAFNEGAVVGEVVTALRAEAPWLEIILVDDGSTDDTVAHAQAAGAIVVRHPYNKGNGAAVKSGIRAATGEYVMVLDGDGQHRPDDATRLVSRLGEYDLVVGARAKTTQASGARRIGNAMLNWLASYLTGRPIPDLTSGFRAARREHLREFLYLLPNGFSTPTTTTLAFIKAGYNVLFEPIEARQRDGPFEDQAGARRLQVLHHPAEGGHHLQPAAHLLADQRFFVPGRRRLRGLDGRDAEQDPERRRAVFDVRGDRLSRRSRLRTNLRVEGRRPAITP